jgi:class 3 adenylate cyclase
MKKFANLTNNLPFAHPLIKLTSEMNMNTQVLDQKIKLLKTYEHFDPAQIERFGKALTELSNLEQHRMNPIRFSEDHDFPEQLSIDMFIHGAKIGLFDFAWNLVCPMCGSIVYSFESIGSIREEQFHCSLCDIDVETDLSDFIEVAFDFNPNIAVVENDVLRDHETYVAYLKSPNYQAPDFEKFLVQESIQSYSVVKADEVIKIPFHANPNSAFRLVSRTHNCLLRFNTSSEESAIPEIVDVDLVPSGISPQDLELPAGNITFNIQNHLGQDAGFELLYVDHERALSILDQGFPTFYPFLTGKALLNNQSFRDLFRIQTLPSDMRLKVSNVTVLFTDLKGSTELYEKTGDMFAYNLVQDHFNLLKKHTHQHAGAIIKTIGDAIMATFSNPGDAFNAAMAMRREIQEMNENTPDHDVAIKIGLHSGTVLAVTANEMLDYFGQTVNLAARVQGLADGGEIWLSESIYKDTIIKESLNQNKFYIEQQSAILKGVNAPVTVYRCYENHV